MFDYETAEMDILNAGGDADYLSYYDPTKRDRYLIGLGLDPDDYDGVRRNRANRDTQKPKPWWK